MRFVEAFCLFAAILNLVSLSATALRPWLARKPRPAPPDAPGVSIVRPVCGIENYIEDTLRSTFHLSYPRYEILFCAASERDPVLPLVRGLIAAHPEVPARLLIGDDRISINPKLNNIVKGWNAATSEWIILSDSNVLMPRDYVEQLFAAFRADTMLTSAPPLGSRPEGLWAELECAFLNTYQARWQLAADSFRVGFAHGKNMMWRREALQNAGGIQALGAEPAEDAAGTKIARAAGMNVRLVPTPFEQPLGHRTFAEVWKRQLRWARLRKVSFRAYFLPELLSGGFLPLVAVGALAASGSLPWTWALLYAAIWYGAEMALAWSLRWPLGWRSPFLAVARDVMLPCLWLTAVCGSEFVWRGNPMSVDNSTREREWRPALIPAPARDHPPREDA